MNTRFSNSSNINQPSPIHRVNACEFGIVQTSDRTNASLSAYIEANRLADLGLIDAPVSMGRLTTANGVGSVSPEKHYPTLAPQACRELSWGQAFRHDCIVGFWALNGQLDLAIDMLRGQGFKVKTLVIWHKVRSLGGNAYLPASGPVQNCSEILIIAQRGRGLRINRQADKFPSVMVVERTTHSTKPAVFRDMLAKLYPRTWSDRPTVKLELFARAAAPGWRVWGNQAPKKQGGAPIALKKAA